jgi:IS30 family transposase
MGGRWQRGPVPMPAEVRAELLARWRSWVQLQAEFECSHQMVWNVVREAGGMAPVWAGRSRKHLSLEDREDISRGLALEQSLRVIALGLGRPTSTVSLRNVVREAGGMAPVWPGRSRKHLSLEDREDISRGLALEQSLRVIALGLGRPTSTVSREVQRNGGRLHYRAARADRATCQRAKRPKATKLDQQPALRLFVENGLEQHWSPEEICGRLPVEFPDDVSMRVVPETIYQALFVQGRTGRACQVVCVSSRVGWVFRGRG